MSFVVYFVMNTPLFSFIIPELIIHNPLMYPEKLNP
jgi:hypothetical protein